MTILEKLAQDEFDSDALRRGALGPFSVVGAVLRAPGAFIRDLRTAKNLGGYAVSLILTTILFSAAYGAILGMFQPGLQTLYAAAKLPVVVLGTALLCTPTFYVFNAILGSKFTFRQTSTAVLWLSAAVALVLVAFAPIVWFFTSPALPASWSLHVFVFFIAGLRHPFPQHRPEVPGRARNEHTPIPEPSCSSGSSSCCSSRSRWRTTCGVPASALPDHRSSWERGLFLEAFGPPLP
jgi:hypothetical protein